ncbi:bifunctional GNAT family N-acetyltransferase/(deoxy)nucleoside triphosphate pyrophosphohydrolase [Caldovatus aquaticus]|uniref:8-oxo-dGTP diphosphatase n=1 Tax=Caldovatus aquaticus TaxID=2865671 RepID=A0ABS7F0P1_9PROT|nr:bifunctional GNAT family N-acetyltransferase/(deoxy)nucleoside triphosphate pyrophosphohydrolase [Caldovatus aquaticus]MBW8269191.1 GNAT family N-acetyltransferase [Caldovatus aquaticus]
MSGSRPRPAPPEAAPPPPAPEPDFAPLTTERLTLRPLRPEDAPALHRLVNDWEVAKNLARVPFPYPRELADEWIASTRARLVTGEGYDLAIVGRDEQDREVLLGCVGLRLDTRAPRTAELGYWVGRRFWGHGVATEAAGRLLRWGLAHLDIDRVEAEALPDNVRSAAVLRRIGFREAGEGVTEFLSRGGPLPVRRFVAGREDLPGAEGGQEAAPAAAAPAQGKPIVLVAAVALIDADGRVLLARRPEGKPLAGLWEFPGGKVHPGETPEAALIRELKEELGIDVAESCLAPFAFASHGYERFHLLMPLYLCRRWSGAVVAREGQALAWVRPQRLGDYAMPPADRPLVALLRDFL